MSDEKTKGTITELEQEIDIDGMAEHLAKHLLDD